MFCPVDDTIIFACFELFLYETRAQATLKLWKRRHFYSNLHKFRLFVSVDFLTRTVVNKPSPCLDIIQPRSQTNAGEKDICDQPGMRRYRLVDASSSRFSLANFCWQNRPFLRWSSISIQKWATILT